MPAICPQSGSTRDLRAVDARRCGTGSTLGAQAGSVRFFRFRAHGWTASFYNKDKLSVIEAVSSCIMPHANGRQLQENTGTFSSIFWYVQIATKSLDLDFQESRDIFIGLKSSSVAFLFKFPLMHKRFYHTNDAN